MKQTELLYKIKEAIKEFEDIEDFDVEICYRNKETGRYETKSISIG